MPFTPSHAVVALPFVRTPLLPAAIAIGAMAPDLPLFVRGTLLTYQETHTNVALSAAVALVLLVVWYGLLRPAVRELSPGWLARRLPREWDATGAAVWRTVSAARPGARAAIWRRGAVFAVVVALSLLLGVLSHIAWDVISKRRGGPSIIGLLTRRRDKRAELITDVPAVIPTSGTNESSQPADLPKG